jgi:hypothetical protein
MNTKELNRLLEKYYNGESSEDEELVLRRYFETDDIPESFKAEKEIFRYYSEHLNIPEPSLNFEEKIIAAIDSVDDKPEISKLRKQILIFISVAAVILVLVGSYFFFIQKSEPEDTFSNPATAYSETVKILFDVSSQLNRGTETLESVQKFEETATKSFKTLNKSSILIENNLKNLDYFQRAIYVAVSPLGNK